MNHTILRNPTHVFNSILLAVLCCASGLAAQTIAFYETAEEFTGPFPSWKNVQTDYGAKGDGVTDDTAAIQSAIDDLRNVSGNRWCTLYFPGGTYRIEKMLINRRREHNDWLGCQIIGEDPATTILQWHGAEGQWMWGLDAWYCRVSRFTFDGRGKAGTGLMRWNNFSTCIRRDFLQSAGGAVAAAALSSRVHAADPVPTDATLQHPQSPRSTKTPLTARLVRHGRVLKIEINGAIFDPLAYR